MERIIIKTENDWNNLVKEVENSEYIAFDTENDGLITKYAIPAGFSIAVSENKGYYVPINHIDIKTNFHERLNELLKNKKIIIMHNSVYDAGIVEWQYPNISLKNFVWFDTMIAQHLLDETHSKGLKDLSKRYFDYHQSKFSETVINKKPTKISSQNIYEYACDDAIMTYKLFMVLKEKLKEEELQHLMMNIEMPFQKVLLEMKSNGITFDSDLCEKTRLQLIDIKEQIKQDIIKVTPEIKYINDLLGNKQLTFNLDSNKDLIRLLYDKLNLPVRKKTEKGTPSVDTDAFEALKKNNEYLHPILPLLVKYKEIIKLLSAYTSSLAQKVINGKIYADFLDHGTVTGRLSSADPNLQQLPKNDTYRIRDFFKASEGYKMMVADFSQEELRICGIVSNSQSFEKAFNNNEDLHLKVANSIWKLGIPNEELITTHPNYSNYVKDFKKYRHKAKTINFGIIYGMSPISLAYSIDCSEQEAEEIMNKYFEEFPEVKKAMNVCKKQIQNTGFTRNMFNRKRRFKKEQLNKIERYPNHVYRQGFNFKIQGSGADILRIVMNNLYDYTQSLNNDIKILGAVHDEIIFEIKDNENFDSYKDKIIEIMENSINIKIQLKVDYDCGYTYGQCK